MVLKFSDRRILFHAIYIFGLTFFSTLGANFIDQVLTGQEIFVCLMTGFISMGLAYFTNMMVQSKIHDTILTKEKTQPKIINCSTTANKGSGYWSYLTLIIFPPFICGEKS